MRIDVKHIAKLANISLKKEEEEKFGRQLSEILNYVEKLNSIDTKNIETTSQVTGLENIVRNDETKPSLTQEEALSGANSRHNGFIKVPAILED